MTSEARWCPQCGHPVQSGYVFCPNCGAQIGATPPEMAQFSPATHLGRDQEVSEYRSRRWPLILFCILLAAIGIVTLQIVMESPSGSGNAPLSQGSVPTARNDQPTTESGGRDSSDQTSAAAAASQLGDTVNVGYWSYCVNGYRWTPYLSEFGEVERANADFLV